MYQYFMHDGEHYKVDFFDTIADGEKTCVSVERPYFKIHALLVKYQHPKTQRGRYGYYVNLPLAGGKKKKLYIDVK